MAHTAGCEGDIFTDTCRGDDCVEKYVGTLGDVAQLFTPGGRSSYNNAGFYVLGGVVEALRGKPYDACLGARICSIAERSAYDRAEYRSEKVDSLYPGRISLGVNAGL